MQMRDLLAIAVFLVNLQAAKTIAAEKPNLYVGLIADRNGIFLAFRIEMPKYVK